MFFLSSRHRKALSQIFGLPSDTKAAPNDQTSDVNEPQKPTFFLVGEHLEPIHTALEPWMEEMALEEIFLKLEKKIFFFKFEK